VGRAAVVVDPVTARDRAIVDAKRQAVERLAGVQVDAQAVYRMGLTQDDWMRVRSFGFVKKYEILEEAPSDTRYTVRMRVWVETGGDASPETAKEFLSQRSFIVLGEGEGSDIVVSLIKGALLERQFGAYDEAFVRNSYAGAGEPFPVQAQNPAQAPLRLAGRFLADYVIRVRTEISPISSTYGIRVYQARVKIQLTEASSGLLKAFVESSERVFGLTKEQALEGRRPDQLRAAVAVPAVAELFGELDRFRIGAPRRVRITLGAPGSPDELDRLANGIRELRWVQGCEKESYSPERATLAVEYPEKSVYLAADIDYLPGYGVSSYGPGYVAVVAEKSGRQ
jgi:hypothetical protein